MYEVNSGDEVAAVNALRAGSRVFNSVKYETVEFSGGRSWLHTNTTPLFDRDIAKPQLFRALPHICGMGGRFGFRIACVRNQCADFQKCIPSPHFRQPHCVQLGVERNRYMRGAGSVSVLKQGYLRSSGGTEN